MKFRGIGYLVAAAVVMLIGVAGAQEGTGGVSGLVRRAGAPVASARVVVSSTVQSKYSATTTTGLDGRFTVPDAPAGGVVVKAYDATNHAIAEARATVKAGETISVTLIAP